MLCIVFCVNCVCVRGNLPLHEETDWPRLCSSEDWGRPEDLCQQLRCQHRRYDSNPLVYSDGTLLYFVCPERNRVRLLCFLVSSTFWLINVMSCDVLAEGRTASLRVQVGINSSWSQGQTVVADCGQTGTSVCPSQHQIYRKTEPSLMAAKVCKFWLVICWNFHRQTLIDWLAIRMGWVLSSISQSVWHIRFCAHHM